MQKVKKLIAENKGFLMFMLAMFFVRSAVVDWYGVPSGSMYPTLMIGDRVIAYRLAYDIKVPFSDVIVKHLADPERGDIVTFTSPHDGVRLVKRLVAVPGDVVEMREEKLFINGVAASYSEASGAVTAHRIPGYAGEQDFFDEKILGARRSILVTPERGAMRTFTPITVPSGQYFMMGDNRDNSQDSRYIGSVRRELLTGRVRRVAFSLDADRYYLPRLERFAASLF